MTTTEPIPFDELAAKAPKHSPEACERVPCGRCRPQGKPQAPEIGRNPHDAATAPPPPDAVVRSIGLVHHPSPHDIAQVLRDAATALEKSGLRAIEMVSLLAARGYATRTLGDGGPRSLDVRTSSTELAGTRTIPDIDDNGRVKGLPEDVDWHGADAAFAVMLRTIWQDALQIDQQTKEIIRHADTADETPAGTGSCRACERFCRPTKERPNFRLRAGLCPSCNGAWSTYVKGGGLMLWSEWTSKRREGFTERNESGQIVRIHTPEWDGQSA